MVVVLVVLHQLLGHGRRLELRQRLHQMPHHRTGRQPRSVLIVVVVGGGGGVGGGGVVVAVVVGGGGGGRGATPTSRTRTEPPAT